MAKEMTGSGIFKAQLGLVILSVYVNPLAHFLPKPILKLYARVKKNKLLITYDKESLGYNMRTSSSNKNISKLFRTPHCECSISCAIPQAFN